MSGIIAQLSNSVAYAIHKTTYDPEAEEFAKNQAKKEAAEKELEKKKELQVKTEKEKKEAEAAEAARLALDEKKEKELKERERFDPWRLTGRVMSVLLTILLVFLLVVFGVFGASLATNLNLYKDAPYRILYAIYGFVFFFLVIPYVLGYRWWWKGKRPRFYSLIPIVPYYFDNYYAGLLLSWMSFKPDCQVESLKEWLEEQKTG